MENKSEVFGFLLNYSSRLLVTADSNSIFPKFLNRSVDICGSNLISQISKFLTIINLCRRLNIPIQDTFAKNKFFLSSYENFLKYFSKHQKKYISLFGLDKNFLGKEFNLIGTSDLNRSVFLYLLDGNFDKISDVCLYFSEISEYVESLALYATEKLYPLIKDSKNIKFLFDFGLENEMTASCDIVFDENILIFTNKSLSDLDIRRDLVTLTACDLLSKEFNSLALKNKYVYSWNTNQLFICR